MESAICNAYVAYRTLKEGQLAKLSPTSEEYKTLKKGFMNHKAFRMKLAEELLERGLKNVSFACMRR